MTRCSFARALLQSLRRRAGCKLHDDDHRLVLADASGLESAKVIVISALGKAPRVEGLFLNLHGESFPHPFRMEEGILHLQRNFCVRLNNPLNGQ